MNRCCDFKLYPNTLQTETLEGWLSVCCGVYNRALEQRMKAYKRRGERVSYYQQQRLLTEQRARIATLRQVPLAFTRDALRRVDRGFRGFFRRLRAGAKPGFPRFRSWLRYRSLESVEPSNYASGSTVRIPGLGRIRARGRAITSGQQTTLRVIRRSDGWYAQVVIDNGLSPPPKHPAKSPIGVDVGLSSFATLSTGEVIGHPAFARRAQRKLRAVQRRLSRHQRTSKNRRKSVQCVRRFHERIAAQRKDFAHQLSRRLVSQYDLIAFENLNIRGMVRNRRLARSIMDAAWGMFIRFVTYKAEYAGRHAVGVHAPGTSQTCPVCGAVKPKSLSERIHSCECGLVIDRDHAAAQVILARALGGNRGDSPVEGMASAVGRSANDKPARRSRYVLARTIARNHERTSATGAKP